MAGTQKIVVLLVLCIVAIVILSRPADADKLHEPFLASTPVSKNTLDKINNAIPYLVIEEFLERFNTTTFKTTGPATVCTPVFAMAKESIAKKVDAFTGLSDASRNVLKSSANEMATVLQSHILSRHCIAQNSATPAISNVASLRAELRMLQSKYNIGEIVKKT